MPGFTFAKGNARKLISLPLYAIGVAASVAVPRSRDRWVFGSGPGIGEGALELYRFVSAQHPEIRAVWLAKDDADVAAAAALGVPAIVKSSRSGLWRTLRAGVVVVTHGFGDVNRYATRSAFVVQLWHGVPLKLIQLDSPRRCVSESQGRAGFAGVLRRFYRHGFSAIRLLPAASELVAVRLRTAFALGDEVVVTGDPRDDCLSVGTAEVRRADARATLFTALALEDVDQRTVLFAPTWRDGESDPGVPSNDEWASIDDWLASTDSLLIIRPHPLGVGDYRAGMNTSARIRLLGSDLVAAITPTLPAFDAVVTDYSSVAYDYSLVGGPIFFIAPDEESYTSSRGLYEPYREFTGGREVRDWGSLLSQFAKFDDEPTFAAEVLAHTTKLRDEHFEFRDGRNTERVYSVISRRADAR